MQEKLTELLKERPLPPESGRFDVRPVFFRAGKIEDETALSVLLKERPYIRRRDTIHAQLTEFIKNFHPAEKLSSNEMEDAIAGHLEGRPEWEYGVWAYYPWREELLHILDEKEFAELRTNRNLYKITRKERDALATKKVGVIGLSVGQSVALTLAMERSFGELRIADFDTLDLSNLNRLRTGIQNLGLPKTVIVAREIAEIDPFLKVTCFHEGITRENMDDFLNKNGKLDLLIEECDSLDIKIFCRQKAKENRIPVLMDTSDRGMIDIERFDLEPERDILHGMVKNLDNIQFKDLNTDEKMNLVLQMVGVDTVSIRGKASMLEIDQSISTWPQLATSVTLGGAITADACRRILLGRRVNSGRFFIDSDELIPEDREGIPLYNFKQMAPLPLSREEMIQMINTLQTDDEERRDVTFPKGFIHKIVDAARYAPSSGNDQPWKWLYLDKRLFLFHERSRSYSFGDFQNIASYISLGAAIENLFLKSLELNIEPAIDLFPLADSNENRLVAKITFSSNKLPANKDIQIAKDLVDFIPLRYTNRNNGVKQQISDSVLKKLTEITKTIPGAEICWLKEEEKIKQMGDILSECDRIRLLHPHGHHDFVEREMRWTAKEADEKKDGIDIATLGINTAQMSALQLIKDPHVIAFLNKIDGGKIFETVSTKSVECASVLGLITMPKYDPADFINGGRAVERLWLLATRLNIALHPLIAPLYFFPRVLYGKGEALSMSDIEKLKGLRKRFLQIVPLKEGLGEIFLFKLSIVEEPEIKALRLPLDKILYLEND